MNRVQVTVAQRPAAPARPRSPQRKPARTEGTAGAPVGNWSLDTVSLLPLESEPGVERIKLPYRERLEAGFGQPLDHLVALTGQPVAQFLAGMNAEAAAYGRYLLFADREPAPETVAHEVVHALQTEGSAVSAEAAGVLAADAPAEAEAERLGVVPADGSIAESVPPNTLALKRTGIPETPPPGTQAPEDRFAAGIEGEVSRPAPAEPAAEEPTPGPAAERAGLDPSLAAETAPEEVPNPTFELPEAPETELSPEEKAAREAALAEAQAAIEQAENPSGVVGAYADAPPSVKAATQTVVGERVQQTIETDQQEFEGNLPEFRATMGGTIAPEEAGEVTAPESGPVALEEGVPAPSPEPDLPPTPTPEPYRANQGITALLSRLFGGDPAEAVGESLRDVKTTDPDIETSPGEKPSVPLEGETDPERIEDQNRAGIDLTRQKREEATQAVIDGRGPEEVQLREMDELAPLAELPAVETEGLEPAEGAEQLNQMGMPEEVVAQFDRDMGDTMQANLAEARGQFEQAETDRDTQREEELQKAEDEQGRLTEDADTEQRTQVLEARKTIQTERQATVDAQAQAVRDLEAEAETERAASQAEIQDRVTADEQQISDEYDQAEQEAKTEVEGGERDAEAEREKAEREAEEKSWWEKAVDFVKSAFAALTAAINAVFDAVRSAIKGILDAVRSVVKGLIDLAASFVKGLIEAFGELLKGLVDATIGQVFPELAAALNEKIDGAVEAATQAVDAVADTLKAGVDAIVDALNSAINAILNVFQGAINAALAIMEAVITGDWGELARKLLEAALRILGIEPAAFYAFIGSVIDTIQSILDDPLGFLSNLVDAVVLGIQRFADNFLDHLREGIVKWLTGALGDIQIPEKFDLAGVLDIARQVLGLTWEWIRAKAVKLIGEKNVERLEFAFSYIQTLIEGGFGALWERLKEDLSGLVDTVFGAIKEFLVEKVIIAGITWLASLFSPVGALVKLVFTIWNLYTFLRDQLARIIQVVQTVVEGLANIVRGVLEPAALKIESVLANLLPIAIDLVARLLGLTGVAKKVREVIGAIRERVDQAIDRLIERVLKTFRGRGEAVEDEAVAGEQPAAAGAVGEALTVPVEGAPDHTLSIVERGTEATVMLATDPLPVEQWLRNFDTQAAAITKEKDKKAATKKIEGARTLLKKLDPLADEYVAKGKTEKAGAKKISETQVKLRDALAGIFATFGGAGAPILDLFKTQIATAHPDAKPVIEKALTENAETYQTLTWEEIRAKLIEGYDTFRSPALKSHEFGRKVQAAAKALVPAGKLATPEQEDTFLSNWVARLINNEADVFGTARAALQSILFGGGKPEDSAEFKAAVEEALKRFLGRDDQPDADLVAAVSGKIIPFLTAVAKGEGTFGSLNLSEWDSRLWGKPANQEWIKDRFRGGGGEHEWIPTNYVGRIIERARASQRSEDAATAALWVTFQDEFRSPTGVLMYPPQGIYLRTVPYPRDPQTRAKAAGGKVAVIQGHVGAVYAPVEDDQYRADEKVVAQTKGQGPWHDELRKIFDNNFSTANSKEGMRKIMQGVTFFVGDSLWFGDAIPNPGFNEYYTKAKEKADGADLSTFSALLTTAASAATQIDNDFKRARAAVKL